MFLRVSCQGRGVTVIVRVIEPQWSHPEHRHTSQLFWLRKMQHFIIGKAKIQQPESFICWRRTRIHSPMLGEEKEKKNPLSKLFYHEEVYRFHESKSSLTWCKIYGSIPADLSLIQSLLIRHMEGTQLESDECCVCTLWGETEGEITGYKERDALSEPRQKRHNLRDVFSRALARRLQRWLSVARFTAP